MNEDEPCRLGYEEGDGARYCFAHGGFVEGGTPVSVCDRSPRYPRLMDAARRRGL